MRGPLGRTYGKHGLSPLPVVRLAWGDTWPRVVLGAALVASWIASMVAAGWLEVRP